MNTPASGVVPTDQRILRAIRILEDAHYTLPTVAELAESLELSTDYFLRLFKAEVGTTPKEYGRNNWLDQAAFRLSVSSDSVAELFADYGYLSQAAFTRAFTRRHGVSPKAYRLSALAEPAPLAGTVCLRLRPALPCWIKRYLGAFEARPEHWGDFLTNLPDALRDGDGFLGLNHDDPRIRPPGEQRYDCCVIQKRKLSSDEQEALLASGFQPYLTASGLYACDRYEGAIDGVGRAYARLIAGWLPKQQRYVLAGEPIMEAFLPAALETGGEDSALDLCIKVSTQETGTDWTSGRDQRLAETQDDDGSLRR